MKNCHPTPQNYQEMDFWFKD